MGIHVDLQWKLIVVLQRLHFPSMRLLHIIDLKTCISLKDLDYRVVGVFGPTAHPGLPLEVPFGVGRCYRL
jgi:hypothetical protein